VRIRGRASAPLFVAAISFALFAALLVRAADTGRFGWDSTVSDLVADVVPIADEDVHVDPYVDVVTVVAGVLTLVVVLAMLRRRRWREAAFPVAAVLGASLLNVLVKVLVDRPAIETADGSGDSFPSGTATWSMAAAAALVVLAPRRRLAVAALLGALFVLGIGVVIAWEEWHYPSDIAGGWLLALGWVALLAAPLLAQRHDY
jgi:membrane-associated phospholipid phosphatase